MAQHDYSEIAAACDRLLRAPETSLARVAIPLLHVIDPHPRHVSHYASLLSVAPEHGQASFGSASRFAARTGRDLLRSLGARREVSHDLDGRGPVDVLIISRMDGAGRSKVSDDFFFGPMESLLRERGARCVTLYPRTAPFSPRVEASISRNCIAARDALEKHASAQDDAPEKHAAAQGDALEKHANGQGNTLERALAQLARGQALSGVTAANLRLHASVSDACARLQPRIVITTYEGTASERMIWSAARQGARSPPLCVGYQHTRLLSQAHAIRRALRTPNVQCDPDVILTLGEIPQSMLAASRELGAVPLITYGSHRRGAGASPAPATDNRSRCLVVPDGDPSECAMLFGFALDCARQAPDQSFTFRPHPRVDFEALRKGDSRLQHIPPNVEISIARALADDCESASSCLYRTSSAVFHAALAGAAPIFLARKDELSFDPLCDLAGGHRSVSSIEAFLEAVRHRADPVEALRAWSYCDRYVSRIRPEALDELLSLAARDSAL